MTHATLIILRDPAGILGREVHALHPGDPLQHQIERAMPAGGAECELLINGERADPFTDPRLDAPPAAGDTVVVAHRPAGGPLVWIAVVSGLLAVAAYAAIPKIGATPTASDSPNNRLTGQTNVARAYQAIPDVYGRRRVWPDLIQPSYEEYVDGQKRVTEWLCISRGLVDVSEVKFADTLLSQIPGSSFEVYKPDAPGTHLPGVPGTYPEAKNTTVDTMIEALRSPNVDGQELGLATSSDALVTAATLTFTNTSQFTLTFVDGPQWATLKGLAGSGSARLVFSWTHPTVDYGDTHDFTSTVVSYALAGANVVFTFNTPGYVFGGGEATPVSTATTATIYAAATSSNDISFDLSSDADQLWWNTVFLRGLDGSVQVQATWSRIDGSGAVIAGTTGTQTFAYAGSSLDQQAFTTKVTPSAGLGRYRITFRRLTADLGNGADVAKLEALYAVRTYSGRTYPGVTLIRVTTEATPQATGVRERKFNCIAERHVRTLSSDTLSASRNAFRAMAHLWTISGQPIGELDTTAMAAINTALGETSALLRFDGSLDDADVSLEERMQLIANHARCVFWRDGTKWTVTRDQARGTPELQLDYRNLAASGQSTVNESFHLPGSRDGVEVEYVDEATGSKKAYVRLSIASGTPVAGAVANPEKLQLLGCTTAAQAENRAHLEARKLLFQRTSVTETALGDAQQLGPLSLVRWVDPADFAGDDGLQAGEVLAIAGDIVTLSEPPDFKGETEGRIAFTGADGMLLGAAVVCTPVSGQPYQVDLASVPVGLYLADGVTAQLGSRYAFGVGLSASEMESAGLYTVTEPRPNGDGTWTVAMVNYDRRVYAMDPEALAGVYITGQVGAAAASGRTAVVGSSLTTIGGGVGAAAASGRQASIVTGGPINGASFAASSASSTSGSATAILTLRANGVAARGVDVSGSVLEDYAFWHAGTVASSWWVRFTFGSPTAGTLGGSVGAGWVSMASDRSATLSHDAFATAEGTWEIAADSGGASIVASGPMTLTVTGI